MRRALRNLTAGACLALSLASCGSVAAGPGNETHSVASTLEASVAHLGAVGDIVSATVVNAPEDALSRAGVKTGQWISLTSSATGYLDEERARWVAGIVISEVWKTRHDAGDDSVVGGELADMSKDGVADGSGMSLVITDDLTQIMFTAEDGVTPSKLAVKDEDAYREDVASAASEAGLKLSEITFTQSLGTVVQITETADDPSGFIKKNGRTNPGLTLDPSQVEGVLLVVLDDSGQVVMTSAWSTGSQSGEGGPGPEYGDFIAADG